MNHINSPDTGDRAIEREIQAEGLTAPRVMPADIEANIVDECYFNAAHAIAYNDGGPTVVPPAPTALVTICVLVLRNGHRIVGVNEGPVSADNFDAELGRKVARQKAIDQVWPLLGYLFREQLFQLTHSPE